jgi:hypothetical protein
LVDSEQSSAEREVARERKREKRREKKRRAREARELEELEAQLATPEPEPEEPTRIAREPDSESGSGDECHPSYEGACLDPSASDYDCEGGSGDGPEYVQGPIRVVGSDDYGLDSGGEPGVACES